MSKSNGVGTTLEHRIGPRGRFSLRQASGDILIRGVEGDTVRVKSLDDKSLSDVFDVEVGDDRVELRQRDGFELGLGMFRRGHSTDLKIEVPHGASLSIETASADIGATDLSGTKRFRTASGEVSLARIAGGVDVETVSGEIEIEGAAPLDLSARTVSGDMDVRVPSVRRLEIGTTSGDIRLDAELSGNGPFAMRSISGDATIVGRSGFRVEAETITGDLSSDLPSKRESMPGRKILVVGRPGPTLTFRSVSGDLRVSEPRDAAPKVEASRASMAAAADAAPADDVRAGSGSDTAGDTTSDSARDTATEAPDEIEDKRLEVLRALERGDITVAEATDQLGRLDAVLR
jgi:putative adhesin